MIWSLAWHPLGHLIVSGSNDFTTKFWTRNRPGDVLKESAARSIANTSFLSSNPTAGTTPTKEEKRPKGLTLPHSFRLSYFHSALVFSSQQFPPLLNAQSPTPRRPLQMMALSSYPASSKALFLIKILPVTILMRRPERLVFKNQFLARSRPTGLQRDQQPCLPSFQTPFSQSSRV